MTFPKHIIATIAAAFILVCGGTEAHADDGERVRVTASRFEDSSQRATDYYLRGIKAIEDGDGRTALALFSAALDCDSLRPPISRLTADYHPPSYHRHTTVSTFCL